MTAKTLSVSLAIVKVGHINIDGLMSTESDFYVGVPQICELFDVPQKNATRDFKALLGKSFTFFKAKIEGTRITVSAIGLAGLEQLILELAIKGNQGAIDMARDLIGLSLHKLFCNAFNLKFDDEDQQAWLKVRQESKAFFWHLTQQIQEWTENRECSKPKWVYYSTAFDTLNLQLFGLKSKQIREELGIGDCALNRDHFGQTALRRIATVQEVAARKMKADPSLKPSDAIKMVVEFEEIPISRFDQ